MKKIIKLLFAAILLLSIVSCGVPRKFGNTDSMLNYKSGVDVERFTYDNVNDIIEGTENLEYGSDITFVSENASGSYFVYGDGADKTEAVDGIYVIKFDQGNYQVAKFDNGIMQEYVNLSASKVPTDVGFAGYKEQKENWEIPLNN